MYYKKGANYYVVVDLGRDSKGKRKQKWFGGYKTKREAEKNLITHLSQIENNALINTDKMTLKEFLEYWLTSYVDVNLSETTRYGYRYQMELHVIPTLGGIQLQKLQPIQLQQLYDKKIKIGRLDGKGGLSSRSVTIIHRVLRKALSHAFKLQLVARNVADYVEVPKRIPYNATVLVKDELEIYISAFKDTYLYLPVILALTLGLRRGETLGLRWQDVDIENKTISINQTLLHAKSGIIIGTPKTQKSHRSILTSDSIFDLFKEQKERQLNFKEVLGDAYCENNLVCCHEDGKAVNPASLSRMFTKILIKHNLAHIRFHDLRHTNATLLLGCKIPAKIVSERLGHSTIAITMDLYSHVLKEMQEESANMLEDIIFKK